MHELRAVGFDEPLVPAELVARRDLLSCDDEGLELLCYVLLVMRLVVAVQPTERRGMQQVKFLEFVQVLEERVAELYFVRSLVTWVLKVVHVVVSTCQFEVYFARVRSLRASVLDAAVFDPVRCDQCQLVHEYDRRVEAVSDRERTSRQVGLLHDALYRDVKL